MSARVGVRIDSWQPRGQPAALPQFLTKALKECRYVVTAPVWDKQLVEFAKLLDHEV